MSKSIIEVNKVSKKYHIGVNEKYFSLRDSVVSIAKSPLKVFKPVKLSKDGLADDEFWALKDISFKVMPGEVLGIIGRNGAGKSTLLKVLSQITPPTSGEIKLRGRVGSLLEVGTGFHPELTGRENIFLNGAILGMKRWEVKKKFDEIVDFAEIEKFLDTPVKHYSSGMYTRLAFAVAAHLEPEILIVDEVLAVGDTQFQNKCIRKMGNISKDGRTILFVSHNMNMINSICNKGILLSSGGVSRQGNIEKVISFYNSKMSRSKSLTHDIEKRAGTGQIRFTKVQIADSSGKEVKTLYSNTSMVVNFEAMVNRDYQNKKEVVVGLGINSTEGSRLLTCVSSWVDTKIVTEGNTLKTSCIINNLPLVAGDYSLDCSISYKGTTLDYVDHCADFEIKETNLALLRGRTTEHGNINLKYTFT